MAYKCLCNALWIKWSAVLSLSTKERLAKSVVYLTVFRSENSSQLRFPQIEVILERFFETLRYSTQNSCPVAPIFIETQAGSAVGLSCGPRVVLCCVVFLGKITPVTVPLSYACIFNAIYNFITRLLSYLPGGTVNLSEQAFRSRRRPITFYTVSKSFF